MLNSIYQALDPVAFSLGPLSVRWYGIAYLLGFICAGVAIYRVARHWKLPLTLDDVLSLILGIAFGVILGGRLFYVIFYGAGHYLANPLEIFMLHQGGMSFHGGLIGALIGGYLACRSLQLDFFTMSDLAAIGAPLGIFFGRIANFINGELWGKATDLPWGVVFETGGNVARHPSQLYEAGLEGLVMFLILFTLSRKVPPRYQGTFIGSFIMLYGIFRIIVEFVRIPDAQLGYLFGFITMGQLLSLPLVIIGALILRKAYSAKRPQRTRLAAS
ncbi:MAG: prolipoprotein diacylglyceryl transferase [Coriobacteriia bacterium]|nr:prolipoprotein diacylglyceryl transferase [Coriobacteriia bacterium]